MEKENKTVFICGYELDASIARDLFFVVRDTVPRVVEEMVLAGKTDKQVKDAAKTTAEAVVDTFIWICQSKAKTASPACPIYSGDPAPQTREAQ